MKPSHFEKLLPTEKNFFSNRNLFADAGCIRPDGFCRFFSKLPLCRSCVHFFLKLVFVVFPAIRSKALDNTSDWDLLS